MRSPVFVVLCLLAPPALADEPLRSLPRPSFEFGHWGAATPSVFSLGLSVHLGIRVTEELAVYVLGQGGLFFSTGVLSGVLEYQFVANDRVTLAIASGVGALGAQRTSFGAAICPDFSSSGGCSDAGGGGAKRQPAGDIVAVGAPLRLIAGSPGERSQLYFAFDGFVGTELERGAVVGALGLSLGVRLR